MGVVVVRYGGKSAVPLGESEQEVGTSANGMTNHTLACYGCVGVA